MKNFKQFLENYDVYIDKPMGFKKADTSDSQEEETSEDERQEESADGG